MKFKHKAAFPHLTEQLGKCLGPADHAGNTMSQWVLNKNGKIMPIQTLQNLTEAERASPLLKKEMEAFDTSITKRFGEGIASKDKISDYY